MKEREEFSLTDLAPMEARTGGRLTALETVTVMGVEVLVFPAMSLATAVRVWESLETPAVFQLPA